MAIISLLIALLLPAIQSARESSRRSACSNNLKQIGLALRNFEQIHKTLPVGAQYQGGFGVSWWVPVLPFLEEQSLYASLDLKSNGNGLPTTNAANGHAANGVLVPAMLCPSSVLPHTVQISGYAMTLPSYVGISGSSNDPTFPEPRTAPCCITPTPSNGGQISAGGLLIPNAAVSLRTVSDGTSKTVIVGECSDFAYDSTGTAQNISGGNPNGWLTGTSGAGVPPAYGSAFKPPAWNITTIKYGLGTTNYNLPGIGVNRGPNNPLLSAHPGVVSMLLLDGSVTFFDDSINLLTLRSLVTRDDGQIIDSF